MAAIGLSTAGITISYGVETTAGTQPSSFTEITGITAISDLNPEPNQLDCTPLSETGYHQYVSGLKDIGGTVTLTANNTNSFQTLWNTLVTASETARATDKATWFKIYVPNLTNAFYFTGIPSALGLSGIEVDSILTVEAYITPTGVTGWGS